MVIVNAIIREICFSQQSLRKLNYKNFLVFKYYNLKLQDLFNEYFH